MSRRTIGVLGGMGPYATLLFFQKLLDFTPAKKDWEHLHIVIDNNPHIPSRSRYYLYGEESPLPGMIEICRRLQAYPVDFIVLPCNSASYFLPPLQEQIDIPILNIMEITVDALVRSFPNTSSVAVLGGIITYEKSTYLPYLQRHGLRYVQHSRGIQDRIEWLIEQVKLNNRDGAVIDEFRRLLKTIQDECDVDAAILGCTELGYMADLESSVKLIDSTSELARYSVAYAAR
jgi:aspartate racemase